jgi:tetratricopeptide (TPR) repeat protein
MKFLDKFFSKNISKFESTDTVEKDKRARQLFEAAMKLGFSDEDLKKKVELCTEILNILDQSTTSLYLAVVFWQRAMAHKNLKNFDVALTDVEQALMFAQRKGDNMLIIDCHKEIDEIKQLKRKFDIEKDGGNKAEKLQSMESQAKELLMQTGQPEAKATFEGLFADLQSNDADIRMNASRILANDYDDSLLRLRAIYQECQGSDLRRAIVAVRVLGRKMAKGMVMRIAARNVQLIYGLNISFIPCQCFHCHVMNFGIPAPPRGGDVPYYHQADENGVYAVPVVCDECSKEFYVVWDRDPNM